MDSKKDATENLGSSRCSTALELIATERQRQIEQEGWTAEHDDGHNHGQLATAAACYAFGRVFRYFNGWISGGGHGDEPRLTSAWPWNGGWWKPSPDNRIRELVKAGALIVAEIERLQRLQE